MQSCCWRCSWSPSDHKQSLRTRRSMRKAQNHLGRTARPCNLQQTLQRRQLHVNSPGMATTVWRLSKKHAAASEVGQSSPVRWQERPCTQHRGVTLITHNWPIMIAKNNENQTFDAVNSIQKQCFGVTDSNLAPNGRGWRLRRRNGLQSDTLAALVPLRDMLQNIAGLLRAGGCLPTCARHPASHCSGHPIPQL